MVGVVGSIPIAPTKNCNEIKHLAETFSAFFSSHVFISAELFFLQI